MNRFERCINLILIEEGGMANLRRDPGGLTKYGISQRAYPNLDIASLTSRQALEIYQRDYWTPIQGDALPVGMDYLVLDCAINQGVGAAIKLLQEAARTAVDGVLGTQTLEATRRAMPGILGEFCALRAWRYEINKNEDVFGKGWFRRLFRGFNTALLWSTNP